MTSGAGMGGAADVLYIDILARVDKLETSMSEAEQAASRGGERAGAAFGEGYRRNADGRLIDAQGRFVKEGEQVGQAAGEAAGQKFSAGFSEKATASSQQFMGILAGLAGTAGAAGVGLVKLAGEAEQAQVAFTTLLGSGEKAKAFLIDLNQFAANTPFELTGLQESSKKLLAFGFQAQQIVPMMTAIGDAVGSLGGGADVLDGVVTALGQIQAKGKVSAEEMAQIAERGIPAWQFLADQMGITVPEAMKKAEQGAISASEAIPAILQGMQNKFGGGMEAQSKTLLGMWSTTTDTMKQAATQVGQAIVESLDLKGKLTGFNEFLSGIPAMLKSIDLKQWAQDNQTAIAAVGGAIVAMLVPALAAGAASAAAFIAPLLPFAVAGAAIVLALRSMGVGLDDLKRGFESAKAQAAPLMDTLRGLAGTVQSALMPVFRTVGEAVQSAGQTIGHVIQGVLLPVFSAIQPHVQPIMESLGRLVQEVAGTVRDAFQLIGRVVDQYVIPAFQAIWPVVKPVLDTVMSGVRVAIDFIAGLFRTIGDVLRGDWTKAWEDLKTIVTKALDGLNTAIQNGWEKVKTAGIDLGKKLLEGFRSEVDGIQGVILMALSNALTIAAQKLPALLRGPFEAAARAAAQAAMNNAASAAEHAQNAKGNTFTPSNWATPTNGPVTVTINPDERSKAFFRAIFGQETGGVRGDPYTTVNSIGALGKYQIMTQHLLLNDNQYNPRNNTGVFYQNNLNNRGLTGQGWDFAALGRDITPAEFLKTPEYQELIAQYQMAANLQKRLYQVNGDLETAVKEAAKDWYGRGKPLAGHPTPDQYAESVWQRFLKTGQTVTDLPKTGNVPGIKDVFTGSGTPAPDPQTLKDYQLTLKDWNALQGKALDLAQRLKKAEDDRNYSAQITLQGEITAWEKGNQAREQAFQLAQKIVSEQQKGTDGPITTAQITKAQQLTAALDTAQKANDPRKIDAAKTAMDSWSKASEGNARALAAVQSAQSGLKKSADDYVATQKDLQLYGDKALVLIKAQEVAQKSGDSARMLAADNALAAFEKQGKAQAAVVQIEQAAYQSRKANAEKAAADSKKLQEEARRDAETAQQQADQLAQKAGASAQEAARIRADNLRTSRDAAVKAAGDNLAGVLAVQQAYAPRIRAAAEAEALEVLRARKLANDQWKKEQETTAHETITDQRQLKTRLGEIETAWLKENSNAYGVYYQALSRASTESSGAVLTAQKDLNNKRRALGEAAAKDQAAAESRAYEATLKATLDGIQFESDEGLVRLYSQGQATRESRLIEAVYKEWERRSKDAEEFQTRVLESQAEANKRYAEDAIAQSKKLLEMGDRGGAEKILQDAGLYLRTLAAEGQPASEGIDLVTAAVNGLADAWDKLRQAEQQTTQAELALTTAIKANPARTPGGFTPMPAEGAAVAARGVREVNQQLTEVPARTAGASKAWGEFQQKLNDKVWLKTMADGFKAMDAGQLAAAKSAAIARQDVAALTLIMEEEESRTQSLTDAKKLMADVQGQLNSKVGDVAPWQAQIDALEKAKKAHPELAAQIDQLIGKMRQLNAQAANQEGLKKTADQWGKLSGDISAIGGSLGRLFGDESGGLGFITEHLSLSMKGVAQGLSGDIGGAVNTFIQWVANIGNGIDNVLNPGLKAWRKNLLEVADAEVKAMNAGTGMFKNVYAEMLAQDAAARQKMAGMNFFQRWLATLTGNMPKVMDEATAKLKISAAEIYADLASTLSTGLDTALMNAFEVGSFEGTEKAIEKSLNSLMAKMMLKAIVMSSGLEEKMQAYTDARAKALQDGVIDDAENAQLQQLWQNILGGVANVNSTWQQVAPGLPGYGQGATEQAPVGSIAALQQEISDLQTKLANATTDADRTDLRTRIAELQAKLDAMEGRSDATSGLQPITSTTVNASNPPTVRLDANVAQVLDMNGYIKNLTLFDATLTSITPRWEAFTERFERSVERFERLSSSPRPFDFSTVNRQG